MTIEYSSDTQVNQQFNLLIQHCDKVISELDHSGFDYIQIEATYQKKHSLMVEHSGITLSASTDIFKLSISVIHHNSLVNIQRTGHVRDFSSLVKDLQEQLSVTPPDKANEFSQGQHFVYESGPKDYDADEVLDRLQQTLDYQEHHHTKVNIAEASLNFYQDFYCLKNNLSSLLLSRTGFYSYHFSITAQDGDKVSSYSSPSGRIETLPQKLEDEFLIKECFSTAELQLNNQKLISGFTGSILLSPQAQHQLMSWFLEHVRGYSLVTDTSLYKNRVGQKICSSKINLGLSIPAPGVSPFADGYVTQPIKIVDQGILTHLVPNKFISNKTGLIHYPLNTTYEIGAGTESFDDLLQGIEKGALVNGLSMGKPGPNGDFSAVIKNSFYVENGKVEYALSETMIKGNMEKVWLDIDGVSAERCNKGTLIMPWLRVSGLEFS